MEQENQARQRHGSPIFYRLLQEMAELHDRKSHDYASNDNPYGNYHFAGKLASLFSHSEQDAGFIGRLGEKLYRLANLEGSQKDPSNESIEDTEKDICVITVLWMADRRNRRMLRQGAPVNQLMSSVEKASEDAACRIIDANQSLSDKDRQQMIDYLIQYQGSLIESRKSVSPSRT